MAFSCMDEIYLNPQFGSRRQIFQSRPDLSGSRVDDFPRKPGHRDVVSTVHTICARSRLQPSIQKEWEEAPEDLTLALSRLSRLWERLSPLCGLSGVCLDDSSRSIGHDELSQSARCSAEAATMFNAISRCLECIVAYSSDVKVKAIENEIQAIENSYTASSSSSATSGARSSSVIPGKDPHSSSGIRGATRVMQRSVGLGGVDEGLSRAVVLRDTGVRLCASVEHALHVVTGCALAHGVDNAGSAATTQGIVGLMVHSMKIVVSKVVDGSSSDSPVGTLTDVFAVSSAKGGESGSGSGSMVPAAADKLIAQARCASYASLWRYFVRCVCVFGDYKDSSSASADCSATETTPKANTEKLGQSSQNTSVLYKALSQFMESPGVTATVLLALLTQAAASWEDHEEYGRTALLFLLGWCKYR